MYVLKVAYEQVSLRAIRQSHRRKSVLCEAQGGPVRGFDSRDRSFGAYFRLMCFFGPAFSGFPVAADAIKVVNFTGEA